MHVHHSRQDRLLRQLDDSVRTFRWQITFRDPGDATFIDDHGHFRLHRTSPSVDQFPRVDNRGGMKQIRSQAGNHQDLQKSHRDFLSKEFGNEQGKSHTNHVRVRQEATLLLIGRFFHSTATDPRIVQDQIPFRT